MIGWLQGQLADRWQQASRHGVLLVVAGVGYELLLARRHWERLPAGSQHGLGALIGKGTHPLAAARCENHCAHGGRRLRAGAQKV